MRHAARVSVFKGRTAKLTKAIFWTLAQKSASTVYDIYKSVRTQKHLKYTRYSTVFIRVKKLTEKGYVKRIGMRKTKAGFEAPLYQLTARAYLAITINQINIDLFLEKAEEQAVLEALTALTPYL